MISERESVEKIVRVKKYFEDQLLPVEPSTVLSDRGKRPFMAALVMAKDSDEPVHIPSGSAAAALSRKSERVINNETSNSDAHSITTDDTIASSTKETIVVMITLTIILFTLVATYYLWRKRRRSFVNSHCKLEEYRYSRLSQNDADVDNISFQGDLTHKSLVNSVQVCDEEDGEDERTKPATLCLEYDSLVTISNEGKNESQRKRATSQSSNPDVATSMLLDDLSDEDILQ